MGLSCQVRTAHCIPQENGVLLSGAPARLWRASRAPYLRKFVNPLIWKILVVMWLSVHILGVHVIVNWQLSAICWPVSRDNIAGSGLELIEVVFFFKVDRWPVTGLTIGSRAQVTLFLWVLAKAKFRHKLTPGTLLTFLLTYSLYNRLLESPWYIAYVISAILVRLVGYSLLKFNWKK